MPHTFDLLVIGDANPDVVLGPLPGPLAFGQREQLVPTGLLTLGGSAAIVACGAARLGLKVAFAGRIGADDTGAYVRDALAARGVDTTALRVDPDLPTPLTAVLVRDGDRAILTAPGTLAATTGDDVPEALLADCRHVHAASYFLMPGLAAALPRLFGAARAHGATTSLDTNDDPAGRWDPSGLAATLPVTDLLLPNAQEARALSGRDRLDEAAAATGRARAAGRGQGRRRRGARPRRPGAAAHARGAGRAGRHRRGRRQLRRRDDRRPAGRAADRRRARPRRRLRRPVHPGARRHLRPAHLGRGARRRVPHRPRPQRAEPRKEPVMTPTKIAFIGAGSVVFTQGLLADLFGFEELKGVHVALHDIDPERLATAEGAARHIAAHRGAGARITAHADRRAALEGADFVINIVQVGMRASTRTDFEIPARYGVRQTIGDTLGIGGIFRALRTFPLLRALGEDIAAVCPDAWLLNYTNPMAMNVQYLSAGHRAHPGGGPVPLGVLDDARPVRTARGPLRGGRSTGRRASTTRRGCCVSSATARTCTRCWTS